MNIWFQNFFVTLAQGVVLSVIYYSIISTSRALAKACLQIGILFIKKKVIIYGAGSSGTELYQSLAKDPEIEVVAFFDDQKILKG